MFTLDFGAGRRALAARIADRDALAAAVDEFGLTGPRPVVAVVGGAGGMTGGDLDRARAVVAEGLLPALAGTRAVVVDGGTDIGVMRLTGRARDGFPLLGVAVEQTVVLPGRTAGPGPAAPLEPHHTHFLLVPGTRWGQETPWLAETASVVAGAAPSVTLLINGGDIAAEDVGHSVRAGRPVLVLAGTGRLADRIAAARHGGRGDERAGRLAGERAVHLADADDPGAVRQRLAALLQRTGPPPDLSDDRRTPEPADPRE